MTLDALRAMALDLRERLAAHAAGHAEGERDALECVALADELIKALTPDVEETFKLLWPCDHRPAMVTYPYGQERTDYTHEGVDIRAPMASVVRSPVMGEVFQASEWGAYGKRVAIKWLYEDHTYEVYLAHLSRIDVQVGQLVAPGQQIGLSGSSGNSTGPHLHLTLRDPANPKTLRGIKAAFNGCLDPAPYLIRP